MVFFYAMPRWALAFDPKDRHTKPPGVDDRIQPDVPNTAEAVERALGRAEYRGSFMYEGVTHLLENAPGPKVFASPPNDLPALLRTADELVRQAKQDVGEMARVWRCNCGTHYAVPVALIRPVAIRCERCGEVVDFDVGKSVGEQNLQDVSQSQANAYRRGLADFFREAMARGWPVLVAKEPPASLPVS